MLFQRKTSNRELADTVYSASSSIHGTGLFAARSIAAGEYIGTFQGPEAKRNGPYVLWVFEPEEGSDKEKATGRSGKNLLRFLNHSDSENSEFDGFDLYAVSNIAPDEEITFNYGW